MLRRIIGHKQGVETVRMIVEESSAIGIPFLTLFAFSAENWLRPKTEVQALMSLLKKFIELEMPRMMNNNIRFNVIGNRSDLPPHINQAVDAAIDKTSVNSGMTLTLALSYGSRQEIVGAAVRLAADLAEGNISPADVDDKVFSGYLLTAGMPDPDLLIRTSGEMRISNFLLWQLAYTELYFTDINWPEFDARALHQALADFQERERRFGRTSDQLRAGR